jgi:hypothetical protein
MRRKPTPFVQHYVVMGQNGLVFSGMSHGKFKWDYNWNNAKPLKEESTAYILRENKCELIKQEEIL